MKKKLNAAYSYLLFHLVPRQHRARATATSSELSVLFGHHCPQPPQPPNLPNLTNLTNLPNLPAILLVRQMSGRSPATMEATIYLTMEATIHHLRSQVLCPKTQPNHLLTSWTLWTMRLQLFGIHRSPVPVRIGPNCFPIGFTDHVPCLWFPSNHMTFHHIQLSIHLTSLTSLYSPHLSDLTLLTLTSLTSLYSPHLSDLTLLTCVFRSSLYPPQFSDVL
eukprot:Em0017g57a